MITTDMDHTKEKTIELFSCVMENMSDEAIRILRSGKFDKAILQDVGGFDAPLPLHAVTILNEICLCDISSWAEWIRPRIASLHERCLKLKNFWESEYGYCMNAEFDFSPYEEHCGHFDDGWDYEMLFDADLDSLISLGYTEAECEFYYAVLTYDHALIQKHLALGTAADVCIGNMPRGKQNAADPFDDYRDALTYCNMIHSDSYDIGGLGRLLHAGFERKIIDADRYDLRELLKAAAYVQLERQIRDNMKK